MASASPALQAQGRHDASFEDYRRLCESAQGDRQFHAYLGCVVFREAPEDAREEIVELRREMCRKLEDSCRAPLEAALRARYEQASRALRCTFDSLGGCAAGGALSSGQFDLCQGTMRIKNFRLEGGQADFLLEWRAGGGVWNPIANAPRPLEEELKAWMRANSRRADRADLQALVESEFAAFIDGNCEVFQRRDSLAGRMLISVLRWALEQRECDLSDRACFERARVKRDERLKAPTGDGGVRG